MFDDDDDSDDDDDEGDLLLFLFDATGVFVFFCGVEGILFF